MPCEYSLDSFAYYALKRLCVCACALVNSLEETLQYFRTVEIGAERREKYISILLCARQSLLSKQINLEPQAEQTDSTDRKTARQAADIDSKKGRGWEVD